MQTVALGYGLGDSRDEELCRVGVGVFPAGVYPVPLHPVHSRVHPVPNHCWSPLSLLPLAQLAKAPILMAACHWQEWVRWPRFSLLSDTLKGDAGSQR